MKNVYKLEFHSGSKEELLPDFESEFPYIASNAELDKYVGRSAPWHWHKAVELFYMESGTLEYYTPKNCPFRQVLGALSIQMSFI